MTAALPRRITVFSPDIPYPANRGGRADIWRRLQALHLLGVEVQLVCFYDDVDGLRPSQDDRAKVLGQVARLHAFPIRKGMAATLGRLPLLARLPWHAACRSLAGSELEQLLGEVADFNPDWVWTEGPWSGMAEVAARRLRRPLIYRSHNIEYLYMRRQAQAARRWRDRLALSLTCLGIERHERGLLQRADWVFDISVDDLAWWQREGMAHSSWLAPLAESTLAPATPPAPAPAPASAAPVAVGDAPRHDVVFLGNLRTPNNVQGVAWLVQEVRPLVLAQRPGTGFVIAGSRPGDFVREVCQADQVTLMADVPDAVALYASARVLVNPVRTGSGTHLKVIEMLMMDVPIVSSVQGTQGLPDEVKRLFHVGDSAATFAQGIVDALALPRSEREARARCRDLFGPAGVDEALRALADRLATKAR